MVMVIVIVINGDRDGVGEGDVMIVTIIITVIITRRHLWPLPSTWCLSTGSASFRLLAGLCLI